jgi:Fic family protein
MTIAIADANAFGDVPTIRPCIGIKMVGTAQGRLCPPTSVRRIARIMSAKYADIMLPVRRIIAISPQMVRRMIEYIHGLPKWPKFEWDQGGLAGKLAAVRHRQGRLIGRMQALGFPLREEAVLQTLTEDVIKSSEIEGDILDKDQVRSSIARRLGMEAAALPSADRDVEGVVEMMLDATQNYKEELTKDRLFGWRASLFPTGRSGMRKIIVGAWRDEKSGPMQVVSNPHGRERIHYEAPVAGRLDGEMQGFLDWFNGTDDTDPVLRAALAHLWFVTIHPFEDGNGRIARAIADMSLARSEESTQRFYSMSAQIRLERNAYYDMLESTQKGDLDITPWMEWFLGCLDRAFDGAEKTLAVVFRKAEFWKKHSSASLNARQRDILNRLLDGFDGKLTSSKWAIIEKCSPDTALRDIADLIERGLLRKDEGGGRSTSYSLNEAVGRISAA